MSEHDAATPRFSVVIPTYQRRSVVCAGVEAFTRQLHAPGFEVIVVVDGSTDGSAEALRELDVPFRLRVLEQPNRGAAAARNAGAAVARGALLLFLDDDMEPHPKLLAEHDASHRAGADFVLGHMPLHPSSPRNLLSIGVGAWAEERRRRLCKPGAPLTLHDLLTGQLSLRRQAFDELGGFDLRFTRDGSFGGEDLDLGFRLLKRGARGVFNAAAISWQRYVVEPGHYFRQWRDSGRSDAELARKHPRLARDIAASADVNSWLDRRVLRTFAGVPFVAPAVLSGLRRLAVARIALGREDAVTRRLVFGLRKLEYLRGAHESNASVRAGSVTVLAYHAIADLSADPVLASYAVPAEEFVMHLDTLERLGYRFISLADLLACVTQERPLPQRGVLLSFDDCYEDLLVTVAPILRDRGIPAVAFAVADAIGGTNAWDEGLGGSVLRLLDADALRTLSRQRIEVGSHSRTHADLTRLADEDLRSEVSGSRSELAAIGLPAPRAFCYPYGLIDDRVVAAVREAGYDVGFSLAPRAVRGVVEPHRLPRVEIRRDDARARLRLKLAAALAPCLIRRAVFRLIRPPDAS